MSFYCHSDRFTTKDGGALPGYKVRAINRSTGAVQPIYSDENGTPIADNYVLQDSNGNHSFFIDFGVYGLELLDPATNARAGYRPYVNMGGDPTIRDVAAQVAADADAAAASAVQATADAAATDADRIAAAASAALADTNRGLVEALMAAGGNPYPNAYASALPRGVTSVTIGGTAITGATVGEYAITGSGGSITGYDLTLVVTSATTATVRVNNTGLGSGTTPPTLTKPAGATLPAGTTLTAVVAPIVADQKAYAVASSDSATVLVYRNNAGAVAALNNPDGTQISFLNAREFRRFIARFSTWRNTAFAVANPHLLRVKVNLVMTDGSTPPDCYVYDIRRDNAGVRCILDIKRVSDNLRIGALATTTSAAPVASSINPTTQPGANGGIGQVTLPIILTTEAAAAGFSSSSNANIDWGGGETWGGVQDGTTTNHVLNAANMGLDAAARALVTALANTAIASNAVRRSPYPAVLQGTYLDLITDDIIIEWGVPGRAYCVNVRSDTAGSTRRLQISLYDTVRGANVAYWARQETYDFASELPESICLAGASLGGPISGGSFGIEYTGATATLFLNKANVRFDQGVTSYTTSASAVNVNRIWSPEETERRILTGQGYRNKLRTFGPGGDFASLKLAVDSLFSTSVLSAASGNADNIQRAWWPFSDLCTPAHQWTLQAMPGHSEVKPAVIPAGVGFARGILCWMGMTIRLRNDTVIKGETTAGVDTYALDYNLGGRIIADPGALVWADSDVAVHSDAANALFIPSVANAADKTAGQQFFRIVGLIEGGRYKSDLQAWSCGVSDGCRIIFRRTVFETTGTGANWATHTSPSNVAPGYYEFDDVTLVGGTKSISLTTSNTVAARHGIRVTNSDVTSVSSGGAGYVRIGKQPGVTYSASLEP